jgi:GNAT superfamily N-acetyltransferase
MHYRLLPPTHRPLAEKFYRNQRSPMRAKGAAQVWVAQADEIIAALCLHNVAHGLWLTSLLVAPTWRAQGIASRLLTQALADRQMPVWLFCHPDLQPFYARLGFTHAPALPAALQQRLSRYQASKPLLAMTRHPAGEPLPGPPA